MSKFLDWHCSKVSGEWYTTLAATPSTTSRARPAPGKVPVPWFGAGTFWDFLQQHLLTFFSCKLHVLRHDSESAEVQSRHRTEAKMCCGGPESQKNAQGTGSGSFFHAYLMKTFYIFIKYIMIFVHTLQLFNVIEFVSLRCLQSRDLNLAKTVHIPTKTDGQTRHSSTYSPDPPQALKLLAKVWRFHAFRFNKVLILSSVAR